MDISTNLQKLPIRALNVAPFAGPARALSGRRTAAQGRRAVLGLAFFLCMQGGHLAIAAPTAEDFKKAVAPCMRVQAYDCAEKNWTYYLQLRPNDSNAIANLGIVLNLEGKHEQAVAQFKKAIALGEGTYDLFAYFAKSLEALGRTGEAIDWSYKTLAVVPELVDVRGDLAKLLVSKGRYYEALALLTAFDAKLESGGERPYFEGQRIAIESTISGTTGSASATRQPFRVSKLGDHFYIPVSMGGSRPHGFVIDTGAAATTVSDEFLASSKVKYAIVNPSMPIFLADGDRRVARELTVASLKVGPFDLRDVQVIACANCALLLGQSTLSRFDLNSSRFQGVEFMTLSPRLAATMKVDGNSGTSKSADVQSGGTFAANQPSMSTALGNANQIQGTTGAAGALQGSSALAVARKCLDLDDSLSAKKRELDDAAKAAKETSDRIQQEGRDLADIRKGLGHADQPTIDAYNRRIEDHNQAVALSNQKAEQFEAEQERFSDAVQARNEMCSNVELNDREFQVYKRERDARRKAASASEASAAPANLPTP